MNKKKLTISDKLDIISMQPMTRETMKFICEISEEVNLKDYKLKKQKEILDKIKEYCNHKLEMLELQKRNIIEILTPENGYLKADIEIEMQKYKDILELLEEIE